MIKRRNIFHRNQIYLNNKHKRDDIFDTKLLQKYSSDTCLQKYSWDTCNILTLRRNSSLTLNFLRVRDFGAIAVNHGAFLFVFIYQKIYRDIFCGILVKDFLLPKINKIRFSADVLSMIKKEFVISGE